MIISRAPVRVSFFGGGTDYPEHFLEHGGAVLATAIDKFSYVTASPFQSRLFDYSIRISYRKSECVTHLDEIEHRVFRECLRLLKIDNGIELHNVADLPAFTGLGSSSTFTVSLLLALHAFKGETIAPLDLAYEAIHIERGVLKEKVGCQDQTMAAVGGLTILDFHKENEIASHPLNLNAHRLEELQKHLVLVFTGVKRSASELAARQIARVSDNRPTLFAMRKMVDAGHAILTGSGPISAFGELLHEAWQHKRQLDTGVSGDAIDTLYATGLEGGALGGKLLGAGGGGFLLFFVPPEKQKAFMDKFEGHYVINPGINAPGASMIFSQ